MSETKCAPHSINISYSVDRKGWEWELLSPQGLETFQKTTGFSPVLFKAMKDIGETMNYILENQIPD